MRRLTFGRTSALGRAMLLAGLLVGVAAAQADDLIDQHHPDQALEQKLDRLDHGAGAPDASPSPDAGQSSFPRSVRIPGTNTSIRVYGSGAEMLQYSR
jgi:hypothetical protein